MSSEDGRWKRSVRREKLEKHAVCRDQYLLLAIPDINTVSDVYRSPSHALVASWIYLEHACTQRYGEIDEWREIGRGMKWKLKTKGEKEVGEVREKERKGGERERERRERGG